MIKGQVFVGDKKKVNNVFPLFRLPWQLLDWENKIPTPYFFTAGCENLPPFSPLLLLWKENADLKKETIKKYSFINSAGNSSQFQAQPYKMPVRLNKE